jgi:hypothetical protein
MRADDDTIAELTCPVNTVPTSIETSRAASRRPRMSMRRVGQRHALLEQPLGLQRWHARSTSASCAFELIPCISRSCPGERWRSSTPSAAAIAITSVR